MFELTKQTAKLANVNLRAEIHGEETKIAVDLKIEAKMPNDVLSFFSPDLKASLYKKASEDAQGLLIDEPGYLPALKFPAMAPIKWGWGGCGFGAVIEWGVSGKDDIRLIGTDIDQFRFDCQDGGTVAISFRIVAHPTPDEIGRLSELVQREITLTLIPPSAEEQLQQDLKAQGGEDEE